MVNPKENYQILFYNVKHAYNRVENNLEDRTRIGQRTLGFS